MHSPSRARPSKSCQHTASRARPHPAPAPPLPPAQAPLFTQKADLLRESLFVVGYDTVLRLVRPDYYGDETAMLLQVGGGWAAGGLVTKLRLGPRRGLP